MELAQAKLAEFKAKRIFLQPMLVLNIPSRLIDKIKQRVDATKVKLKELGEDAWEPLRRCGEYLGVQLLSVVQATVTTFKD